MEWNCSEWNILNPTRAINKTGNHKADAFYIGDFVTNAEPVQKACNEADIIIVERNLFGDTLTMMQYWKVRNKVVASIFDDAYHIIHPQNISHNFWMEGEIKQIIKNEKGEDVQQIAYMRPTPLTQLAWGLRMVKGAIMPSYMLANDWKDHATTYQTHNYLEIEKYLHIKPLFPHDDIIIGWCGSLSHYASFMDSGVLPALVKTVRNHNNVRIMITGDKRVYDRINVPADKKIFSNFVPAEQWTSLVKTLDIGLAPLAGEYDRRRSWIKVLEYMALQVPWVATNYETYSELTQYGRMTENGGQNWEEALEEMVENIEQKREFAKAEPYQFALEMTSDKNVDKNLAIYQSIIDDVWK